MLLYPLAITLGLLGLLGGIFQHDRAIYASVTFFTLIAALFDFFKALPKPVIGKLHLQGAIDFAEKALPFFDLSVGWLCPAIVGLAVGVCIRLIPPQACSRQGERMNNTIKEDALQMHARRL